MFDLAGKHVVVTGGGRGIGRGIARAFARAGAGVLVAGRTASVLDETVHELTSLRSDVEHRSIVADIARPGAAAELVGQALAWAGYLDCWVNNAGSANPSDVGPLIDLDEGQWDRVVDLNMKATFFAAQAAARAMTQGGSIINITSRSASNPNPNTGQYGAAKAAIENLTATMAVEWGHRQIRVNAVAPGIVLTELDESGQGLMSTPARRQRQIDSVPLQRLGVVDDVGPACVFLASDEAAWITGAVLPVNGGSRVSVGYMSYLHHASKAARGEGGLAHEGRG